MNDLAQDLPRVGRGYVFTLSLCRVTCGRILMTFFEEWDVCLAPAFGFGGYSGLNYVKVRVTAALVEACAL